MISTRFDKTEFTATFRKLASGVKTDLPTFTTAQLLDIAENARDLTPVANRGAMLSYLGGTISSERVNSKGKIVRTYNYKPQPVVYAIVNARRKKAGLAPVPRGQMADEANKFIASKLRAVGSLRSGWSKAIGILSAAVKKSVSGSSGGPNVRMKSRAKPARDGWNPTATLEYRETVERDGIRFIDVRVETALNAAFQKKHGEMLRELDKQMNATARKAGAK